MRFPGDKPQWIVMQEEEIEAERDRRIGLQLVGRMTPPTEYIIEKMKRRYSKYGKQARNLRGPAAGAEKDKGAP